MKNFRVANKLFISYAVIITMLIAGCVVSIVDLVKLGGQIQTFYNGPFTVNSSANIVNANFEGMQKSVYRSISNTNPEIIHEAMENAEDAAGPSRSSFRSSNSTLWVIRRSLHGWMRLSQN